MHGVQIYYGWRGLLDFLCSVGNILPRTKALPMSCVPVSTCCVGVVEVEAVSLECRCKHVFRCGFSGWLHVVDNLRHCVIFYHSGLLHECWSTLPVFCFFFGEIHVFSGPPLLPVLAGSKV